MANFEEIENAKKRIGQLICKTPVLTSSTLDAITGRNIFLKCENLQKTGSFKARGALNAVLKLKQNSPDVKGVATYTSGNHGMALSWAASLVGLKCSVVAPHNISPLKIQSIKDYGGDVIFCDFTPTSRLKICEEVAATHDYVIIPTNEHWDVINGAGTVAMEFLDQVPDLDAILVITAGGALAAGVSIATKSIKPSVKVYAVEPEGKGLGPCLKAGKRLWPEPPRFLETIADGATLQPVTPTTFPILCPHMEKDVFTVDDTQIVEAMKFLMQRMKLLPVQDFSVMQPDISCCCGELGIQLVPGSVRLPQKIVVEPTAAAPLAAVMSAKIETLDPEIRNIGVILTGGNVDVEHLPWHAF